LGRERGRNYFSPIKKVAQHVPLFSPFSSARSRDFNWVLMAADADEHDEAVVLYSADMAAAINIIKDSVFTFPDPQGKMHAVTMDFIPTDDQSEGAFDRCGVSRGRPSRVSIKACVMK
jgi:hypothetical protein